ncbi:MAG TPA: pilus assembly protein TadG-related protein [Acidimicrobiales bacterium]|nr:pilus assembly protein TadG-related protein [Acidimicrobiales bacterium]
MGTARRRWSRAGDEGGTLALYLAFVVTSFVMAGFVIDLGHLRAVRLQNQSTADLAALAAGRGLTESDPQGACADAWKYLRANAPGLRGGGSSLDCSALGTASACSNTNPVPRSVTAAGDPGGYTITISYPVPAAELAQARFASGQGTLDGDPCQRMRVSVQRSVPVFFGQMAGIGQRETRSSAVVRGLGATANLPPALWFLDPHGCPALSVSGGSRLTLGTDENPGILVADSDGTACTGSQTAISVTGTNTFLNVVPQTGEKRGTVNLFAMPAGATACSGAVHHDCDSADVTSGRITPQPVSLPNRSTRSLVDWRFNCKTGYPAFHGLAVRDCPNTSSVPPYIDNLRTAVKASGRPSPTYQQWSLVHGCSPVGMVLAAGNWWVDCPNFTLNGGATVIFTGGNVVFDGNVSVTAGSLAFNTANLPLNLPSLCVPTVVVVPCIDASSVSAAFVYMRNGNLSTSGGSALTLNRAMLYQASGYVEITGNSPPVWSAPLEGPFTALALWSELSTNKFQITGGASMDLKGTFFTPEAAPFSLSGGSPLSQQNAQFITYQLAVSGGAQLTMAPQPTQAISYLPPKAVLIR